MRGATSAAGPTTDHSHPLKARRVPKRGGPFLYPESNAMNPDQPITELFTQPGCQPCKAVERKLVQYGIPYIVHDISTDENARERVRALGYTQTPVVLASDGTSFSGLHLGKLRALRDD